MPFNGSGTFNRLYSWVVDAANNVNISSTRTDAEMNGFAAALTNCVTRDGQSPPSADLPMGGKKLTNLGDATTATDALNRQSGDARYVQTTSPSFHGGLTLLDNNYGFMWTDANGGHPKFVCQSDNNLVLYGTDGAGADRVIASILMHSSSSALAFGVTVSGVTASPGDNSTKFATTAFVVASFAPLASPTFTGTVTIPTPTGGDNSTKAASTAYVQGELTAKAPLASPTFTGTPAAPTASQGTSTTQLATTAYVEAARNTPRGQTITSSATVTPTFADDFVEITAQAAGLTLANPTGTAQNMWGIVIRIKDNGGAQTIAYGTQYRGVGLTLPTTTVAGKTLVLGMIWNNALTKVDVVSAAQE